MGQCSGGMGQRVPPQFLVCQLGLGCCPNTRTSAHTLGMIPQMGAGPAVWGPHLPQGPQCALGLLAPALQVGDLVLQQLIPLG